MNPPIVTFYWAKNPYHRPRIQSKCPSGKRCKGSTKDTEQERASKSSRYAIIIIWNYWKFFFFRVFVVCICRQKWIEWKAESTWGWCIDISIGQKKEDRIKVVSFRMAYGYWALDYISRTFNVTLHLRSHRRSQPSWWAVSGERRTATNISVRLRYKLASHSCLVYKR